MGEFLSRLVESRWDSWMTAEYEDSPKCGELGPPGKVRIRGGIDEKWRTGMA
jgi:hypothetical protein